MKKIRIALVILVLAYLLAEVTPMLFERVFAPKTITVKGIAKDEGIVYPDVPPFEIRGVYVEKMPPVTVADLIRNEARKAGFEDDQRLVDLAWCESSHNPEATNRNSDKNKTLDRGLFMWNDYWHPEISDECAFDAQCATKATIEYLQRTDNWDAWYCNK